MVKRIFSAAQNAALEEAFKKAPYLNAETKVPLLATGLADSQIKTWFQNTRFKRRRNHTDPRLDFETLLNDSGAPTATSAEGEEEEDKMPYISVKIDKKPDIPVKEEAEDNKPETPNKDDKKADTPIKDDKKLEIPVKEEESEFSL